MISFDAFANELTKIAATRYEKVLKGLSPIDRITEGFSMSLRAPKSFGAGMETSARMANIARKNPHLKITPSEAAEYGLEYGRSLGKVTQRASKKMQKKIHRITDAVGE